MAEKIRLVQGDSRPQIVLSLTDEFTGVAINLSEQDTVVRVKLREAGATSVKATMICGKLLGFQNADGTINYGSPYNVPGAGGRVFMDWEPNALSSVGEYEAEIEITYPDGSVQTVYDVLKFRVRAEF
jgi:hypothetical protein